MEQASVSPGQGRVSDMRALEECEHLVDEDDPDTALCGVDQSGVPWNQGFRLCQACLAVVEGRMS